MRSQKRSMVARFRRGVHVRRLMKVEYVGGTTVDFTCTACGTIERKNLATQSRQFGASTAMSPGAVADLVEYWKGNGGVRKECTKCTKNHRDKRFPLP